MTPFKLVINGQAVEVPSLEDAAALLGAMKKSDETSGSHIAKPAAVAPAPLPAVNGSSSHEDRDDDLDPKAAQMTLKFLKAIRDAGPSGGLQSDAVMNVLGLTVPKAIGAKSAVMNLVLTNVLGMRLKSVYINPKTPTGRFWKPGRKIDEAISQLEQRVAAVH